MGLRGFVMGWICVAILAQSALARADAAEVEALIAKGNELRRAGTPGPALPYFRKAYELARTPRTTAQLGLAELAAGYPVEAAEHLAAALETPNDPSIVKYRQMLADSLTTARSQIGELAIAGSPPGAEIVIDGRAVGVLPLSAAIKLAARSTEIVVRAPGFAPRRELVPIAGGQRHELTVNLEKVEKAEKLPEAPAVIAAPNPPPPPAVPAPAVVESRPAEATSSGSGLRTSAWTAGGGAVIAAGAGLALNLSANSKASTFDAGCANLPGSGIAHRPEVMVTDADCRDRYDAWQSRTRWAIVGYATGAALAITSGILFWVSQPPSPATHARAHLTCAPTQTGLSCQGNF
jgi:hypothetical protein